MYMNGFKCNDLLIFQVNWVYRTLNVMTELKTLQQRIKAGKDKKK